MSSASAVLLYLAFPPISLAAFALMAFVPLLILEEKLFLAGNNWRTTAALTSVSFLLANVLLTWWVKNAAWSGLIAGAFYNTILMSLAFGSRTFFRKVMKPKLASLSWLSLWIAVEYLHLNHFELDFPWLILGHAFADNPIIIQWYEWTGVLGGSIWILGINLIIFNWIKPVIFRSQRALFSKLSFSHIVIIVLPLLWSTYRYYTYEERGDTKEVVVLQPNIDPYGDKFNSDSYRTQLDSFLTKSFREISLNTLAIIWPETSIPGTVYLKNQNWQEAKILSELATKPDLTLITGASAVKIYNDEDSLSTTYRTSPDGVKYDYYNCAFAYNEQMERQFYVKSKLVIGVEKMPYLSKIAWLKKMVVELGGASGQLGYQENRAVFYCQDSLVLAPVICYESVYGQYVTEYIRQGANAIAVLTNDGWWGNTPGHKQHLSHSRMRAIESRRAVVRSANTGISAIIDQKGEIQQRVGYWEAGSMLANIRTNSQLTFYVKYGDFIGRFGLIMASLLLCIGLVKSVMGSKND